MRDPYSVLGVAKSATAGEIKSAYRKLAKKYHPDANHDPKSQDRFGEVSRAYEIVGDEEKRKQFDRGEIDAEGHEVRGFGNAGAGGDPFGGFRQRTTSSGFGGAEDILSAMFGGGMRNGGRADPFGGAGPQQRQAAPTKGKDIEVILPVSIHDIIKEGKAKLKLADGRTIAVTIPKGVENDQIIRLKGQGQAGPAGHRGDILARVRFRNDAGIRIEGANILMDVDLPLKTAVKGGKIAVSTPQGKVALKVAPWTSSGAILRLKGRGLPLKTTGNGDLLAVLRILLDDRDKSQLEAIFNNPDEAVQT